MTTPTMPYEEVVARCRQLVEANVPGHAGVAVLSKGDDRLTDLGGRRAWHLPSLLDGSYAGHHPADGAEAVSHLETLRTRGADFLLIPATSLWWLDHYPELREHLAQRSSLAGEDPAAGRLYRLGRGASSSGRAAAAARRVHLDAEGSLALNVSELVEALLPPRSTLDVLGVPGTVPLQVGERAVRRSSLDALEDALDVLADQRGFLILTQDACRELERDHRTRRLLEDRCRTVTDQRHVCRILEVGGPPAAEPAVGRRRHLRAVRERVERVVEEGATVAVISRGDDELLRFDGRVGWHFPRQDDGVYAGHYPADDREALALLDRIVAAGARWLVVPAPAAWWLDHYGDLRDRLESDWDRVADDAVATIYRLERGPVRRWRRRIRPRRRRR